MSQPTNPFLSDSGKKATCMEMLQLILDGEASDEQRTYFKTHLDHCMPCFKSYEVDMAIKEMLKTKCCGGDAPNELIQKIRTQLGQEK